MPHQCRVLSRFAFALVLLLCVALSDGWAQVTNPVTLYRDETLHWDAFNIAVTGACKVSSDSRTLGIGLTQIRFLDSSRNELAAIVPSSLSGNYYLGQGWQQIEGNPATAPSSFRWTNGVAPSTMFYYPTPSTATYIELTALTPPCGAMSASISVNGINAGTLSLPSGAGNTVFSISLPSPIPRTVHYGLQGPGTLASASLDWLDNNAVVISTVATAASLTSAVPSADFTAQPPASAVSWRVNLSSPASANGNLLVSFNNASARVLPFTEGQSSIICATSDPLSRQADLKTATQGWGDDFNARNSFNSWISTSAGSYAGSPAVQNNGATVLFGLPADATQVTTVDMFTASAMAVNTYRYLSIRLKSSAGSLYFIRPFGVDSSGQIQPLYIQNVSPTEAISGTGDWQTETISLPRLVQNTGVQSPALTEVRIDIVNNQGVPGTFELDWLRVHQSFEPDPGNCAASKTNFASHIDENCNGLTDQDDEQAWIQFSLGHRLVFAYYHPWFGTPFEPSGQWISWSGSLSDFSNQNVPEVPITTIDPNTYDPAYPGKRNLVSHFYPLDYRTFPAYRPPADGSFHYDVYGGVDHYDNLDQTFDAAQISLASRYGIDGFIAERDLSDFLTQRYHVARRAIASSGTPFLITPLYDNYYLYPPFGLLTERSAGDMAADLLTLYSEASASAATSPRFEGRPFLTAPFRSFSVSPDKWGSVINQASNPASSPFDGTVSPGTVEPGPANLVTFTFSSADQPGAGQRYLSVAFRTITFLDSNFSQLSQFAFGTPQTASQLVMGWGVNEQDATGTFVWAAGTAKRATLNIAIPTGAVFLKVDCNSFGTQNLSTIQINDGPIVSFTPVRNLSTFTFRLNQPTSSVNPNATSPFALFLDSQNVADGVLTYGPHPNASRVFVSTNDPVIATVESGYDDTKIRRPGSVIDRQNGMYYRQGWEQALQGDPDVVAITTWNEWAESTNIEPSVEFGYQYVELTLTYSLILKRSLQTSALPSQLGLTVTQYSIQGANPEIDFNTTTGETGATAIFTQLSPSLLAGVTVSLNGAPYSSWSVDYTQNTLTINLSGGSAAYTIANALLGTPSITAIVNGADFKSEALSPGDWISILGQNLGQKQTATAANTLTLGGASVSICGLVAVLSYNSGPVTANGSTAWQINALVPNGASGQTTCPVIVTVINQASQPVNVQIASGILELFEFASSAGSLPIITHADYSLVGPATATLVPAKPNETVIAWGTGGCSAPGVTVGGGSASVVFSGQVAPGLCQVNFVVPNSPAGSNLLKLSSSPSTYSLWVSP